jgi:hypothetical protein
MGGLAPSYTASLQVARSSAAMSFPGIVLGAFRPTMIREFPFRAVKAISRSQWNGGFGAYAVLPEATPQGALSAQLRHTRRDQQRPRDTGRPWPKYAVMV